MAWTDPSKAQQLLCLVCVIERKQLMANAKADQYAAAEVPVMRPAVTMASTHLSPMTLICYEHLQIQVQSPLAVPAGRIPGM